jgi:uncharacterized protein (DUF2252 family)
VFWAAAKACSIGPQDLHRGTIFLLRSHCERGIKGWPRGHPNRAAAATSRAERPIVKNKQSVARPGRREPLLAKIRNGKMARSPGAYVRGNTVRYYEWLERVESGALPEGPAIWICGACHVGNLGPVGNARGKIEIQIRDLDQTVIGNPAHDLIRLSLSLASAARGSDLPGLTTVKMLERIMHDYQGRSRPISTRTATSKSRSPYGGSRKSPPRRLGNRSPRRTLRARTQLGDALIDSPRISLRPLRSASRRSSSPATYGSSAVVACSAATLWPRRVTSGFSDRRRCADFDWQSPPLALITSV